MTATSANDSTSEKQVLMVCPEGKVAVGVLATTSRPQSVHFTELWPAMGVAYASARETLGTKANWQLTGTAICINRPGGLEYILETESRPSKREYDWVGARATCPDDKELLGFGAKVTGGRLVSLMPKRDSPKSLEAPLTGASSGTGPVLSTESCPGSRVLHAAGGWVAESDTAYSSANNTTATQTSHNTKSGNWTSKVLVLCAKRTK